MSNTRYRAAPQFSSTGCLLYGRATVFGHILHADSTAYIMDTSGSMYKSLGVLKQQLTEHLHQQASYNPSAVFNIFSTNQDVFSAVAVSFEDGYASARDWLRKLQVTGHSDLLTTIQHVLEDKSIQAIYLMSDGIQPFSDEIVNTVKDGSVPVHCIWFAHDRLRPPRLLMDIARVSLGSLQAAVENSTGAYTSLSPIVLADYRSPMCSFTPSTRKPLRNNTKMSAVFEPPLGSNSPPSHVGTSSEPVQPATSDLTADIQPGRLSRMSVYNASCYAPCPFVYPWLSWHPVSMSFPYGWEHYRAGRGGRTQQMPTAWSPAAGALLVARDVLANVNNGIYSRASVRSQLSETLFLVELLEPDSTGRTRSNEVHVNDLVTFGERYDFTPGKYVLAELHPDQFAPAQILSTDQIDTLSVEFYHGLKSTVSRKRAAYIPSSLHQHLKTRLLEQAKPTEVCDENEREENPPTETQPVQVEQIYSLGGQELEAKDEDSKRIVEEVEDLSLESKEDALLNRRDRISSARLSLDEVDRIPRYTFGRHLPCLLSHRESTDARHRRLQEQMCARNTYGLELHDRRKQPLIPVRVPF